MRALFLRARIASVRHGARRLRPIRAAFPGLKARPGRRNACQTPRPVPDAPSQPCGSRRKAGTLRRPPLGLFSSETLNINNIYINTHFLLE